MASDVMPILLSESAADERWGKGALLSYQENSITIHLLEKQKSKYNLIQQAARKLDASGINSVALLGDGWDLELAWHFWLGYYNPKKKTQLIWPTLSKSDQNKLISQLRCVEWARKIINRPAAELSPEQLANEAISLIKEAAGEHVSYQIIKGEELKQHQLNGIYTVGKGSVRPAVFLSLDYNPIGDKNAPVQACLVGKGITFDSGGYSLKQSSFMDSMKSDMGGAALVTASLALAIQRGLSKRIKLFLCCADNLVSGDAFKLGDIIHYRNGKTVEVMNTDAEGRLVLADGLITAEEQNSALIIDCATLTGAAKTALGNDYHAALSFDDQLIGDLMKSAAREQETFWRLPLAEFHRNQTPSNFADLSNTAAANTAGASTAAAFLSHFLQQYQKNWLHIDCSATYRKSAVAQWAAGATGIGVRTLANLLLTRCSK